MTEIKDKIQKIYDNIASRQKFSKKDIESIVDIVKSDNSGVEFVDFLYDICFPPDCDSKDYDCDSKDYYETMKFWKKYNKVLSYLFGGFDHEKRQKLLSDILANKRLTKEDKDCVLSIFEIYECILEIYLCITRGYPSVYCEYSIRYSIRLYSADQGDLFKNSGDVVKFLFLLKKYDSPECPFGKKLSQIANECVRIVLGQYSEGPAFDTPFEFDLKHYLRYVLMFSEYGPEFIETYMTSTYYPRIPKFNGKTYKRALEKNPHITEETKKKWKELQNIYDILQ